MINLANVMDVVSKEYPDSKITMDFIDCSTKYKVVQTILDDKIAFRNIAAGGDFGEMSDEDFSSCVIETISIQKGVYAKLDRAQVIRDGKTIMFMDMADPTSFHKLTEKEFDEKVKLYDIKKDELKKKEEPVAKVKVYNSGDD
jgi:hypothetical protein